MLMKLSSTVLFMRPAMATIGVILPFVCTSASEFNDGTLIYDIDDSAAKVVGLSDESAAEIIVPDNITVDGKTYPVSEIDDYAFMDCEFTNVSIGNQVMRIGMSAFEGCYNLCNVAMGCSVDIIDSYAFCNTALTSIEFPESLRVIENQVFEGADITGAVNFGKNLCELDVTAFRNNIGLTHINIDSENACYSSIDGVLFDKDISILYFYPYSHPQTSFTLPNTVKTIEDQAMRSCKYVTDINLNDGLEKIGSMAFAACKVKSLYIPKTVTEIGGNPVAFCTDLSEITVDPDNSRYYVDQQYLLDKTSLCAIAYIGLVPDIVTIPEGIAEIGEYLFYGADITKVNIPSSVRTIAYASFYNCAYLNEVNIEPGLETIGKMSFQKCTSLKELKVPATVREIQTQAFCRSGIVEFDIPEGVTTLGQMAFAHCQDLKKISIPSTMINWDKAMCYSCPSLEKAIFAEGLTFIGDQAFNYCSSLVDVSLPQSITSIGEAAFYGNGMTSIDFPSNLNSIGESAFYGTNLTEVIIPDNVASIGSFAFAWAPNLQKFTLGKGVKKLEERVLHMNPSLVEVNLPEGLEEIDIYAISFLSSLTSITLPSTVTQIAENAFSGCRFTNVHVLMPEPPALPESAFCDEDFNPIFDTCTLYVPTTSIGLYQSAPVWNEFLKIQPDSDSLNEITASDSDIVEIYDLQGIRHNETIPEQVNIIRYKDGSTRRVFVGK